MRRPASTRGAFRLRRLPLRARLRNKIVCFAERTAGTTTGQPGVQAPGMERMSASEASDIIIRLQRVDADSARVTGIGKQLRCKSSGNVFVVVVLFLIITSPGGVVLINGAIGRLHLLQTKILDGGRPGFLLCRSRFHALSFAGCFAYVLCNRGHWGWSSDWLVIALR